MSWQEMITGGQVMSEFEATAYLSLAFVLRCVLPLAATLFIGYLMNRVSSRREREEALTHAGG